MFFKFKFELHSHLCKSHYWVQLFILTVSFHQMYQDFKNIQIIHLHVIAYDEHVFSTLPRICPTKYSFLSRPTSCQ